MGKKILLLMLLLVFILMSPSIQEDRNLSILDNNTIHVPGDPFFNYSVYIIDTDKIDYIFVVNQTIFVCGVFVSDYFLINGTNIDSNYIYWEPPIYCNLIIISIYDLTIKEHNELFIGVE